MPANYTSFIYPALSSASDSHVAFLRHRNASHIVKRLSDVSVKAFQRLSLDIVADLLAARRQPCTLTAVRGFTKEGLAYLREIPIDCVSVTRKLELIMVTRGKPKSVVNDNGAEQQTTQAWHLDSGISRPHHSPGDPMLPAFAQASARATQHGDALRQTRDWRPAPPPLQPTSVPMTDAIGLGSVESRVAARRFANGAFAELRIVSLSGWSGVYE